MQASQETDNGSWPSSRVSPPRSKTASGGWARNRTASANFALLKSITETLAGRAIYFELEPFTRRELANRRPATAVLRQLFDGAKIVEESPAEQIGVREVILGGLPQVRLHPSTDPSLWFRGYVQTYLERDVRELSPLIDLVAFRDVVRLAALRTGQVLNSSELARDAKQNSTTTSRYLSVLEAPFVIRRLTPYLANRASRIIKSPKLYMTDSGLAAHLIGLTQADAAQDPCWGALLESYVAQNLAGILAAEWPGAKLHYWHVQGRYEVDFVIESGRDCMAIEVKASPRWSERDLLGLVSFLQKTPRCRVGVLAYGGRDIIHLGDRLWAVPMPVLLA